MNKLSLLVCAALLSACGTATLAPQAPLTAQKGGGSGGGVGTPLPPPPISLPPRPVVVNPPCSAALPNVLPSKAFDLTFWYPDGSTKTGRWETGSNFNTSSVSGAGTAPTIRSMEYADGQMVLGGTSIFAQEKYGQGELHGHPFFFFAEQAGRFGRGSLNLSPEDAWGVFESASPVTSGVFELTWLSTAGAYRVVPVTSAPCRESYRLTLTATDGTVTRATWTVNAVQNYAQPQLSQELWGSAQFPGGETVVAKGYRASETDVTGFNVSTPGSVNQYVIWLGQTGDLHNLVLNASADPAGGGRPDAVIQGRFSSASTSGSFVAERQ